MKKTIIFEDIFSIYKQQNEPFNYLERNCLDAESDTDRAGKKFHLLQYSDERMTLVLNLIKTNQKKYKQP